MTLASLGNIFIATEAMDFIGDVDGRKPEKS